MPILADSATWIVVGLASGAAALALVASLVLLGIVLRREPRGRAPEGPRPRPRDEESEPDEALRSQRVADIATTIEIDAVLERALSAATELARVDAAMIVIPRGDEDALLAISGMTAEEAAHQPVSRAPSGGARAVRIGYRYLPDADRRPAGNGEQIGGGVTVPVADDKGSLGTLAVFWRGPDRDVGEADVARLEDLASSCAPAIRNAQRFHDARLLADVDALTGLASRRSFHETLARESARAHRYERRLALLVLAVDDVEELAAAGEGGPDEVLSAVAGRVRDAVRSVDVACRASGDELAVVLPEASARDGERLFRRIQFAVARAAPGRQGPVRLSAGVAELRPEDDGVALLQRAEAALRSARHAGRGQLRTANGPPTALGPPDADD